MKLIRVVLADDHALVRAGIRAILKGFQGIEVVAEAKDGREAVQLIRELRPDVALLDIAMPGMNGLDALRHLTREAPDVRTVILSMHPNEEYVIEASRAGALGYLLKDSPPAELERCLRAVAGGEEYFSPRVSQSVLEYQRRLRGEPAPAEDSPFEILTPRQREVLQLIAEGNTSPEIANIMGIDAKTVETHRSNLMSRLGLHDVASLTRYALRKGLIKPDEMK